MPLGVIWAVITLFVLIARSISSPGKIPPKVVCIGSRIKMLRICSSPEARICEAILGGFTLVHT